MSSKIMLGTFNAKIVEILFALSSDRPAIITRLETTGQVVQTVSHVVRLNKVDSTRIGLDEIRKAFPTQLAVLPDVELIEYLLENTSEFIGTEHEIVVSNQVKDGVTIRDGKGVPYVNVHLKSKLRDMPKETAKELARHLLSSLPVTVRPELASMAISNGESH